MSNYLKIPLQIGLFISSLAYPFVIVFLPTYKFICICVLSVFWGLSIFYKSGYHRAVAYLVTSFFVCLLILQKVTFEFLSLLPYFYPIMVSLVFLCVFASSLRGEAIITRFARLKHSHLTKEQIDYTRNLTKIWCIFFIINSLITLALIFLEDKSYWSIFCGIISYLLMGGLFVGELIFRYFFIRLKNAK